MSLGHTALVDAQRDIAARIVNAIAENWRSPSPYTFVTVADNGTVRLSHTYYDRLSSAVNNATLNADLYGLLAYSVRRNVDGSFTVFGGPTVILTAARHLRGSHDE